MQLSMSSLSAPVHKSRAISTNAFLGSSAKATRSLKKGGKSLALNDVKKSQSQAASSSINLGELGFTKGNELFVGRLAMLGFASALVGEIVSGQGALAQFGVETGLPMNEIPLLVAGLAVFNVLAAVLPTSGTFQPEEQQAQSKRPAGPVQDPSISLLQPRKFFGITRFGFTKANELFVGRVAQLGFAAALIGEYATGKGPLEQFGMETGIPILDSEAGVLALIALMLFASINEGSGKFVKGRK